MSEYVNAAIIDFFAWISNRRRTYAEAMEAWQSSCRRHTVWEDALTDGLIQLEGTLQQPEATLTRSVNLDVVTASGADLYFILYSRL